MCAGIVREEAADISFSSAVQQMDSLKICWARVRYDSSELVFVCAQCVILLERSVILWEVVTIHVLLLRRQDPVP